MRKIYSLLAFSLIGLLPLTAQITIDASDVPPFGAVLLQGIDTTTAGLEPGPAGANQSWDFSGRLTAEATFTNRIVDPAETTNAADFPDATLAFTQDSDLVTYAQVTNEGLFTLGGSALVPGTEMVASAVFDPPQQLFAAPSTFGTTFTNEFGFRLAIDGTFINPLADSVEIRERGTTSAEIDGWGTVKLPDGEYEVLRQRVEEITVDSFFVKVFGNWAFFSESVDTSITYEWWAKDGRATVLAIEYDLQGNADEAIYLINYSEGGGEEPPVADFTFNVGEEGEVQFTDASTNMPASWMWDFGDGNSSTEQNPTHTYMASGNYTVCLTATNSGGSNQSCQEVEVVLTSVKEAPEAASVRAYPSPVVETLFLEFGELAGKAVQLKLFSNTGQLLRQQRLEQAPANWRLPLTELPTGIYRLLVESEGRFIKTISFTRQ